MYSGTLNDDDIRFYDNLDQHLDGEEFTREWQFNHDLDLESDFNSMPDDLGEIVQDLNLKFSPESSDSGNYSPKSNHSPTTSECFNSSDSWNTGLSPYGSSNGYVEEPVAFQSPPIQQNFQPTPPSFPTPKLTPVNVTQINTPTFYTTTLPSSSSNNMVVARPLETITLVPAKLTPAGQTFVVSSAPALKLAPIQKPVLQPPPTPTISSTYNNEDSNDMNDDYRKKMEDRRLRNRAAAQASRHRKRQQMDTMKDQLERWESECMNLRAENENLRKRVADLEKENEMLLASQGNSFPKHKKARTVGVCLAMCALVFTFSGSLPSRNTSYSTDLQLSNAISVEDNSPEYLYVRRHGRSLAEVQDYDSLSDPPEKIISNKTICPPMLLNLTEKIRLNNDLNNWIARHEQMDFVELRQGINPFLIHNSPKTKGTTTNLSNSTNAGIVKLSTEDRKNIRLSKRNSREKAKEKLNHERLARPIKLDELNRTLNNQQAKGYEVAVRSALESRLMDQLAAAIKQEDDVLYVVTMKDYFLLPVTHRNATSSPKISIVIPALNSSNPNQIQMLQIDCIVSSTRNFYLPDSLVSLFNRSNQN